MKLIDKDALVAEIKKRKEEITILTEFANGTKFGLEMAIDIINSLEVKEVDLGAEIQRYLREVHDRDTTVSDVARHFANWRKEQMINKGAEWLRKCLDNGMWVDQFLSEKDKEAIVLTYKENMEEEFKL